MFDLGGGELLLILVAVLILFGPKKLPELAQGLGKGLRQFRQAQREFTEQINSAFEDEQRQQKSALARPGAINTIARSPSGPVAPPAVEPTTGNTEDSGNQENGTPEVQGTGGISEEKGGNKETAGL